MVDPEVRDQVPNKEVLETVGLANKAEDGGSDANTEVTEEDQVLVLALVQRAAGKEVVDAAVTVLAAGTLALSLLGVIVVPGDVVDQVHGPAEKLLGDHVASGVDRGLLEELVHLVEQGTGAGGVLLARPGHKDHVTLHVAGGLVVLAVADLPAEVGDEESRVADPANGVVQGLAGRERLVTALVGKDPETGSDKTLNDGVAGPEKGAKAVGGNVFRSAELVEGGENGGQDGDVTEDIVETSGSRALKAVLGDGVSNVLDGVIGQLELVAVSIDQLLLGLQVELVLRGERGEGGGGGRGGRRVIGGAIDGGRNRVGGDCASGGHPLREGGSAHLDDRLSMWGERSRRDRGVTSTRSIRGSRDEVGWLGRSN